MLIFEILYNWCLMVDYICLVTFLFGPPKVWKLVYHLKNNTLLWYLSIWHNASSVTTLKPSTHSASTYSSRYYVLLATDLSLPSPSGICLNLNWSALSKAMLRSESLASWLVHSVIQKSGSVLLEYSSEGHASSRIPKSISQGLCGNCVLQVHSRLPFPASLTAI